MRAASLSSIRLRSVPSGYRRDDVVGRDLADVIIPPSLREKHRRGLARYLATGETRVLGRRVEMTAIHADGSEFPAELAITRIPLGGTSVLYWLSARHHGTQTVGGGTAAQSRHSSRKANASAARAPSHGGWRPTKSPGQTAIYRIFEFDPRYARDA